MDAKADDDARLAALMVRAQGGDRAAYARLLTEVAPIARRAIRARCPYLQASDVEDLAQDVLLSLHAARASYQPDRPFLPWLLAITRYRIADGARDRVRRYKTAVVVNAVPETFSAGEANTLSDAYGDVEALNLAMAGLSPKQRTAVELVKLRELSLAEAATATGMSQGALKVAVHRGIAALKRVLVGKD